MPFLTEELWHAVYDGNPPAKSIALTRYPKACRGHQTRTRSSRWQLLQGLIVEVRALRKEIGVEEKAAVPIELRADAHLKKLAGDNRDIVERLARVSELRACRPDFRGTVEAPLRSFDVAVVYERTIDVAAERERLTKDIARYEKGLAAAERQLGNEAFLKKAPAQVVEGLKKQEAETRLLLEKAREALKNLPPE